MQARLFVLLMVIASSSCRRLEAPTTPSPTAARPAGRHVIVVSIDGLMPEAYLTPDRYGLKVPTLRQMVASGASAQYATSVMPAVTYPAHTTIATGVAPAAHGIVSNRAFDPLERNQEGWRWYSEDIHSPTLWDITMAAGRTTALINWPVTMGAKATFLVPEYWRAGTAEDQKLMRAMATPGLLDAVQARFPNLWTKLTPPDVLDEGSADVAVHLLETAAPDLIMIHIWMVDEMQHRHGPWSRQALDAIEEADRQLQRIITACQRAELWDDTALVVVSDHGFARFPIKTVVRPAAALAERGLIERGADGKVASWKASVQTNGGTAYVYLADPTDLATATAVRNALEPLAQGPEASVRRVLSHADLLAMGGDPQALFALEAADGYAFADGAAGPLRTPVTPPMAVGTHGWAPDQESMRASFLAMGPKVAHADLGAIRLLDVAPTVARWLGVALPSASGTAVTLAAGAAAR
jgi:predicted AlkP superfamily pyrophosphatase or phosphodiesterase